MREPSPKSLISAPAGERKDRAGRVPFQTTSAPDDDEHDRGLIRWSLSLHPEERLAVLQDFVDTFWTPAHG